MWGETSSISSLRAALDLALSIGIDLQRKLDEVTGRKGDQQVRLLSPDDIATLSYALGNIRGQGLISHEVLARIVARLDGKEEKGDK